jgi:hypothetical protein
MESYLKMTPKPYPEWLNRQAMTYRRLPATPTLCREWSTHRMTYHRPTKTPTLSPEWSNRQATTYHRLTMTPWTGLE